MDASASHLRARGEPPLRNPHSLHPFLLALSVVESSSALQLGHLPEAGHPQWDVRCLTQAPAALGLKPQLRPAAGFLVKKSACRRLIAAIGRVLQTHTAETVNQSLFLLRLGLWQT